MISIESNCRLAYSSSRRCGSLLRIEHAAPGRVRPARDPDPHTRLQLRSLRHSLSTSVSRASVIVIQVFACTMPVAKHGRSALAWRPPIQQVLPREEPQMNGSHSSQRELPDGRVELSTPRRRVEPALQRRPRAGAGRAAQLDDLQLRGAVDLDGALHPDLHAGVGADGAGDELVAGAVHDPARQHDRAGPDPAQLASRARSTASRSRCSRARRTGPRARTCRR